jgi:hypothetical protein
MARPPIRESQAEPHAGVATSASNQSSGVRIIGHTESLIRKGCFPYQCIVGIDFAIAYRHIRSRLVATSVVALVFFAGRFALCTRSCQLWASNEFRMTLGMNRLRHA